MAVMLSATGKLVLAMAGMLAAFPVTAAADPNLADAAPETGKPADKNPQRIEKQVQAVFKAKCTRCHGQKRRKADLDLSNMRGVLKGGESGPAIVPGKPDESLLYERIKAGEMPPDGKNRPSAAEIEIIRQWIASGAKFQQSPDTQPKVTQHDVIPLMHLRCTVCHGLRRREAGLDLRTKASMLKGGKSGPAIVLGKPGESLIVRKIESGKMPPLRLVVSVSVKPMQPHELELVKQWIATGAPEIKVAADVDKNRTDPLVSDEDRNFWAFRPPHSSPVPIVQNQDRAANPIDAFIIRSLEQRKLSLSPQADRLTLLRRACFDLTGLPPSPREIAEFLADDAPDLYPQMIDRLLASPRYGERWGRHWLDLAGYSDSEGVQDSDLVRPHAYRYRDYVIRAFNADKPYDRFLLEQIAGDELADYENADVVTQQMSDNLVATGFLRMAIDGTFSNITNFLPDRNELIAREMEVLGSAVLGLTLKCARCHSHKFDPIPQRDYYRLLALFKGALDEHDWLKPQRQSGDPGRNDRLLSHVPTAERTAWEHNERRITEQIAALKKKRPQDKQIAAQIKALEVQRRPQPLIRALWDRGEPSPTYILKRGNYLTPGRLVGPGVPAVLADPTKPLEIKPPWPNSAKTGRRLAFARWLVHPDHPLTSRVMVNRIWRQHFGVGLVKSLDNFGKAGARPTHPQLLDWLAVQFVKSGWSVKAMHRLMMNSSTYRQSSQVTPIHERLDPDNRLLSRMSLRRMDAEELRDTMIFIASRLDERRFGPGDGVDVRGDGLVTSRGTSAGWRRSIYLLQRRSQIPTLLENFDLPAMSPNCIQRRQSTVAPQALHLLNNGFVDNLAGEFARRVMKEAGPDRGRQIDRVYLLACGRKPSQEQLQLSLDILEELTRQWEIQNAKKKTADQKEPAARALKNFCRAIMNSAQFLYID